jgi:protein O-mannosyl-transferase
MAKEEQEVNFKNLFVPFTNKKAIISLIIVGLLVYFNGLFGSFVWDDRIFIQYNPAINNLNPIYLFHANSFNNQNVGVYHFIPGLYSAFMHVIFGNNTFFYHLIGLLIHIINTILIFSLFRHFFKNITAAFLLSLVFLIHLMQVESVTYISGSGNNFFLLFGLSALLLSFKEKIDWKRHTAICGLLLLSLLTKETGILFLVLVILYGIIFTKHNKLSYFAYTFISLIIYMFLRFVVAGIFFSILVLPPIQRLGLFERFINIPAIIFYYFKTFLFPLTLIINQNWIVKTIDLPNFYIPLAIDIFFGIVFVYLAVALRKNTKYFKSYIFFLSWFTMGMLLHSQIFPLEMTVAERWFYFSIAGLLGIIGIIYSAFPIVFSKIKASLPFILIIIFSLLGARTIVRNTNWSDPITLYTHDAKIIANFDTENTLGAELSLLGKSKEALVHFKKSISIFPYESNLSNLAQHYKEEENSKDAKIYFYKALNAKYYGDIAYPHRHLDLTYESLAAILVIENPIKALKIISFGLNDYPNDAQLWMDKGLSEYRLGDKKNALNSIKKALLITPNNNLVKNTYNSLLHNQPIKIE